MNVDFKGITIEQVIPNYVNRGGVFLCLSGEAEFLINDGIYKLTPGIVYIVSPILLIQPISQSADFGGIYVLDMLEVFQPILSSIADTIIKLRVLNNPCVRLQDAEIQYVIDKKVEIEQLLLQSEKTISEDERMINRRLEQLTKQKLLLKILGVYQREQPEARPMENVAQIIYKFLYSLNKNYREERSVEFYAKELNLSKSYFITLVKRKIGRTPLEMIITMTMTRIKLELEQSDKSIKEIAAEYNFPEQFTFRKYFKRYEGVSPKEYRQRVKRVN